MEELIKKCQAAKHIMFITGAGISEASGLSTYRGKNGLYTKRIIPPEIVLSKYSWKLFPSIVWKCIYKSYKEVVPNIAHYSIVLMEALVDKITVVTQNVDGLHKKAGSSNVIELHGNMESLDCKKCGYSRAFANSKNIQRCPNCNGYLRPPVVLFGENLPEKAITELETVVESSPDVTIVVGTTGSFPYIIESIKASKFTALIDPVMPKSLAPYINIWIQEKAEDALVYLSSQLR